MPSEYRLLIHNSFQYQIDEFLEKQQPSWDCVVKQLRKIIDSPEQLPMQNLPPQLSGKVFHVHVPGYHIPSRKGFRLIYIVLIHQKIVLPVYLSLVIKSQFNYDEVPWQEYAHEIYEDLHNANMEKFTVMTLISK